MNTIAFGGGAQRGRLSVKMQWMNEFSDMAQEELSQKNLQKAKQYANQMNLSQFSGSGSMNSKSIK